MSRHSTCGCAVRADGSTAYCRAHRLQRDLRQLGDWYGKVVALIGATRNRPALSDGGGSTGNSPVNMHVPAFDFAHTSYLDQAGETLPGIEWTVLGWPGHRGIERTVRLAFGEQPVDYPVQREDLARGLDPQLVGALRWLAAQAPRIIDDCVEAWVDGLFEELHRLNSRARSLVEGPQILAGWDYCPDCHKETRLVDPGGLEQWGERGLVQRPWRATCVNAVCEVDGAPRCWEYDGHEWRRVPAPRRPELGEYLRLLAEARDTDRAVG